MERQKILEELINSALDTQYLEVLNESHMHSVPPNSETHFKVTVVSDDFSGKSKVARHQIIYALVGELMQQGLHALALHTYVTDEWRTLQKLSPDSPNCMGGSKGT